jgi:hypothetical protein
MLLFDASHQKIGFRYLFQRGSTARLLAILPVYERVEGMAIMKYLLFVLLAIIVLEATLAAAQEHNHNHAPQLPKRKTRKNYFNHADEVWFSLFAIARSQRCCRKFFPCT